MLIAALRDLQWRVRRFVIAVAGCALVFGMTLLMTGVTNGFDEEAADTVRDVDADAWVVRAGASGPFLGAAPMLQADVDRIATLPGVEAAGAMVFTRKSVRSGDGTEIDVNILGATIGAVGMPTPTEGRAPAAPGEVVISSRLDGYDIGDPITISGVDLQVVGKLSGSTALAGTPNVFLPIADAQRLAFGGQPVATAAAVRGTPTSVPEELVVLDNDVARADLLRAIAKARSSLTLVTVLLWIVAASIIGAVTYLTALERQRDFAVFKATGVATRSILAGMVLQAALLSVAAALLGSVVGETIGPRFPMLVSIDLQAHLLLPFIAVAVGLVASLAGLRRIVAVDPARAFGGP